MQSHNMEPPAQNTLSTNPTNPNTESQFQSTNNVQPPYVPVEPQPYQPNTQPSVPMMQPNMEPYPQQPYVMNQPYPGQPMQSYPGQPYSQPYPGQPMQPYTSPTMYNTPPTMPPGALPTPVVKKDDHKQMEKAMAEKQAHETAQTVLGCIGAALLCIVCCPLLLLGN